jgi:hypothetical protein
MVCPAAIMVILMVLQRPRSHRIPAMRIMDTRMAAVARSITTSTEIMDTRIQVAARMITEAMKKI